MVGKLGMILMATLGMVCLMTATMMAGEMSAGERVAIIKGLKLKGIVGENNRGFLEFRGAGQAEEVVKQENADRQKTYSSIAGKQGVANDEVGKQRALQNATNSPSGTWLQKEDGSWYRKP